MRPAGIILDKLGAWQKEKRLATRLNLYAAHTLEVVAIADLSDGQVDRQVG